MGLRVPDLRKGITERKRSEIAEAIRVAEKIVELHSNTMQIPSTIAQSLGVTMYGVRWVLSESGISIREKPTDVRRKKRHVAEVAREVARKRAAELEQKRRAALDEKRSRIVNQYKAGATTNQLAEQFGVSHQRISQIIKAEGCEARPSHRPRVKKYMCKVCRAPFQLGRKKPGEYASRKYCSKACSPVFNRMKV